MLLAMRIELVNKLLASISPIFSILYSNYMIDIDHSLRTIYLIFEAVMAEDVKFVLQRNNPVYRNKI